MVGRKRPSVLKTMAWYACGDRSYYHEDSTKVERHLCDVQAEAHDALRSRCRELVHLSGQSRLQFFRTIVTISTRHFS